MIAFILDYIDLLPYEQESYYSFFDDDSIHMTEWHGISIQYSDTDEENHLVFMRECFTKLIERYDIGENWFLNHCIHPYPWFKRRKKNEDITLPDLRHFLKKNKIQSNFVGALYLPKYIIINDIIDSIVTYPYKSLPKPFLYRDLDISHKNIPLVIQITHHGTIDVITKDKGIINDVKNLNFIQPFYLVEYRKS